MNSCTENAPSGTTACEDSVAALIRARRLVSHLQPLVLLRSSQVAGHEALVRTPPGCAWRNPDELFAAASLQGVELELELECARCAIVAFMQQSPNGCLFVNLSASALLHLLNHGGNAELMQMVEALNVSMASVVIEITEHQLVRDVDSLRDALFAIRSRGVSIALDDFGDGRSSLRLWSSLKPEYVKIDKYFIRGIATSGEKLQTCRALLQIAETFGSELIAEGIESAEDLRVVRDLGIRLGQGYYIGRPQPLAVSEPSAEAAQVLGKAEVAIFPQLRRASNRGVTAAQLLIDVPPVSPQTCHEDVFDRFSECPEAHAIAVVDAEERPVALISRARFIALYVKRYSKELYGRRPCILHANHSPLLVDINTRIEDLTEVLTSRDQGYLTDGFIITAAGCYRGLGTGEHLVRRVTESRIEAARHANPLTFLPGNIPITQHIERLIDAGAEFVAAYADLNHFKPYNDQYGYWRGDEMIRLAAEVILSSCDAQRDFVGHVGGDDFVILFQSGDWRERCDALITRFNDAALGLFDEMARAQGGIVAEDRHGVSRFHPCTTISVGAALVNGGEFGRAEDVASAAALAKRAAKRTNASLALFEKSMLAGG